VERAWIRDIAPEAHRGSAFGLYHAAVGIAALPASVVTGFLWDHWGPQWAFCVGAGLALGAIGLFLLSWRPASTGGVTPPATTHL
jgi:MFS family permease